MVAKSISTSIERNTNSPCNFAGFCLFEDSLQIQPGRQPKTLAYWPLASDLFQDPQPVAAHDLLNILYAIAVLEEVAGQVIHRCGCLETFRINVRWLTILLHGPGAARDKNIVKPLCLFVRHQTLDQLEIVHTDGYVVRADQLNHVVDVRKELIKGGALAFTYKRRPLSMTRPYCCSGLLLLFM